MKPLLKYLYHLIPFKYYVFLVWRTLYVPSEKVFRHLHFNHIFKIKIDKKHTFKANHYGSGYMMESDYFWKGYGGTEKHSAQIWASMCNNASVIIDIGANTGMYALSAACINSSAKIIAFEPAKKTFDVLQTNVKLNSFKNITCIQKAVSDTNGYAVLYSSGIKNDYTASLENTRNDKHLKKEVDTTSITDIIDQYQLATIDLIKIDVEGHEYTVLKGMGNFLSIYRPAILLEVLNNEQAQQLMTFFNRRKYLFFNINEEKGLKQTGSLEKSDHNNCLVLPEEKQLWLKTLVYS